MEETKNNMMKMLYPALFKKCLSAKGIQVLIPWYPTLRVRAHLMVFFFFLIGELLLYSVMYEFRL